MIRKLKLQNIRIFSNAEFEFSDGVNLIVGPNGSGKTTLLEAIGLFAFGSFQSISQDVQAVTLGGEIGRVEAKGERQGSETFAECVITEGKKTFRVLTNKVPASQIVGFFKAVLFNPETIDLVSGAPHIRRRELDIVVAQKKRPFVKTLLEYKNVLKQRNQLIKRITLGQAKAGELAFWDGELVKLAKNIVAERKNFLKILNADLSIIHEKLIGKKSGLMVKYLPSCDYGRFDEFLAANLEHDLRAGLTLYGPHRDDFEFMIRNTKYAIRDTSMRSHASRGEQRLASIAFKMETKKYLTDGDIATRHLGPDPGPSESGFRTESGMTIERDEPILIFDDVFSELDKDRRESVASVLNHSQIFISATDERVVPEGLKKKAKIIRLELRSKN